MCVWLLLYAKECGIRHVYEGIVSVKFLHVMRLNSVSIDSNLPAKSEPVY